MASLNQNFTKQMYKRIVVVGMIVAGVLTGVSLMVGWPTIHILIGFFAGFVTNLITFKMIIMSTDKMLSNNQKPGSGMQQTFFFRIGLYGLSLFLVAHFTSIYGMLALGVGVSMVGLAIKLDTFLPSKETLDKTQ